MESGVLTRQNAGSGVHVDAVDVAGLDDAGLDLRLRLIGRARNQLDGFLAEAVAEKKRRTTPFDTANTLKSELRQSGQQAQRTMRQAEQLGNPRLADGTPLPQGEFRKLACDAEILTGIFDADLQCLSLGRQRHPSPQLRAVITARDQGCIGCRAEPEWCVSHHIVEWQDDGPTQADNLVLLCHDCHHKAHHRNHKVEHHPDTGRPYLRPPWQQPPEPPPRR